MAKMPTYGELTGGKKQQQTTTNASTVGSMPSFSDLRAEGERKKRQQSIAVQRDYIRRKNAYEKKFDDWILGDSKEDISRDIDAYETALEALKRYGWDFKSGSEWISGLRDANNVNVRQNLIDDVGNAKEARKGTAGQYLLRSLASAVAGMQGDMAGAQTAQQEAASIAAQRKTSKEQQKEAEKALAAHREKYGQNLVASEILEQAYKDEDEAIRILRGNNQSNRNYSVNAGKVKEAEEKLKSAQETITELGGKVNANWMVGGLKQSGGQLASTAAWIGQVATEYGSKVDEQLREAGVDSYTVGNSMIPSKVTVPATDDAAKATKEVMDKAQQLGTDLSMSGAMEIESAKAGKSAAEQVLIDIGVQAQNMAIDAAANFVAPGAGMTMMGARAFGGGVQTAYEQDASVAKAGLYAAAVTGAELLSEKVTGVFSIPYGKGAADGISDYFIGKMASTELGRQAWSMLASGLGEGLEEGITAVIEPFANAIINNKSVWENLSDLEAGDVFYQMFIGAVLGYAGAGVQGLTQGQSAEANFFRNAAEAGLSLKQAAKIWADTELYVMDAKTIQSWSQADRERVVKYGKEFDEGTSARTLADKNEGKTLRASNVQAQMIANGLTREEGHKTSSEKEAERKMAEIKAEDAEYEYYEKLTRRAQANKVLDSDERMAEFTKRTGVELKGSKGDQARTLMAVAAEKVQEIEQKRTERRKEAEAAKARAALAEMDTGDVTLNEKGETLVKGEVVDMSVQETLQKMGFSEARAADIAKQYDPKTATKGEFAKAMRSAYLMARAAVPEGEISTFVEKATPQQRQIAAAYGEADRVNAAKEAQAAVEAKVGEKVVRGEGGIINETGRSIDPDTLDAPRKAGYQVAQALAKAVGNNVHLFESVEKGGKRVLAHDVGPYKAGEDAPNGWYDHATGDIYVDINAGERGQGTILYTLSHEYTHFIRQWSPEKFETLAKFLFENADISIEAAIQNQMDKAASAGRDIDRDKAMEEVVADAMEAMLSDTNAAEKIIELRNRDKGLWEKLKELITKIRDAVRSAYKDFAPDSHEGLMLKRMDESLTEKLSTLFAEGVADAAENYSRAAEYVSTETAQKLADHGLTIVDGIVTTGEMADLIEKEGVTKPVDYTDISNSYRTTPDWANSFYERFGRTTETERVVNEMLAFTERMVATDALRNYVPMGEYAYSKYGPLRGNMEYLYTFDMDTTCPRTFQFLAYRDALQKIAKRPLTYRESVNLLEVMRAYGQQIPCSYCYVENKRVLLSSSYNNFFTFRNNVMNAATDAEAKPLMYGYNAKKKTLAKAAEDVFKKWRSDRSYNPTISECWDETCVARNSVLNWLDANFNTESGKAMSANKLTDLVSEHFGISEKGAVQEIKRMVDDWVYDVNAGKDHMYDIENDTSVSRVNEKALALHHEAMAYAKSASSAKSVENYVPYTDQLKNVTEAERSFIMGMGGIRKHSSNDFRIDYVQDYMLFYADLAAAGWTGHTYTKSADFVKIFANTKDRINMSIAFYGDTADTIRENHDEGASWNDARQLRGAYDNVGVMAMVTSDAQLTYALNSNWVDMIIPFHASGLDKKVWYNLRMWNDYTKYQLEKPLNAKEKRAALREAGVSVPSNAKAAEISNLYDQTFNTLHIYDESGRVKRPHFLPGDTEVNGQIVPGHHNDVQRYFDLCRQYGVHPRFYGVKVQDANGNTIDVTEHPNYLKLIKETARTDTQQEAIEFNFDKYDANLGMTPFEYAMKRLEEEANNGGFKNTKEDPCGIVKEFAEEYLGKDRPLGYLTERATTTRALINDAYAEMQDTGVKDEGISLSRRRNWKKWSEKEPTYAKNNRNGVFITDEFVDFATESDYSKFRMEKVFDMNEREYQSFSRSLSNLTTGMTAGEERDIIIYTAHSDDTVNDTYAYILTADGYRRGNVLVKVRITEDDSLLNKTLLEITKHGRGRSSKILDRGALANWYGRLRHLYDTQGVGDRGTSQAPFGLDGRELENNDEADYYEDGSEYYKEPLEGAMVYDPDAISLSLRDQAPTDRYVLTNAEGLNDTETRILARYREESGRLAGFEDTLEAQRETLKELLASDIRDKDVIRAQREAIQATENRINIEHGILARMEESATLQRVLKRERDNAVLESYERGRFDQGYESAPKTRREMDKRASEEFLSGYERGRFDQGIQMAAEQRKAVEQIEKKNSREMNKRAREENKKGYERGRFEHGWKMAEEQRKAMEYAEKQTGNRISRLEARLAEAEAEERRRVQQLRDYRQNQGRKDLLRKIGKTTKELNDWLLNPTKDKHIPSSLQAVVVEALDAVNMDTVNAEERLAALDQQLAEVEKALSVTTEYANRQRLEARKEKLLRQQKTINRQGYRVRENLSKLQSAYTEIRDSNDPVLAGAFDENISAKIQEVWQMVGDTSLRDMSVDQLQMVYDLYRMVSKSVRNANKAFKAGRTATIEGMANDVRGELSEKKRRGDVRKIRQVFEKMAWTDLKPIYAFKTIGSKTMTDLFNSVRAGEDTWAKDVGEAREFYLEEARKHNANSWDMEKKYKFTSTSGLNFELTLSDIMSIYAYSKREQALDHLTKGGIVLEKPDHKAKLWEKVSENATAYNLSPEILAKITGTLTTEQKAFVDAMQDYLSSVMGGKGNEVSDALYDVKLFNEKNYFPLRSSKAYMARAKEQQAGEVKIKNSGFTKAVTPNASNPIVLQPFMEVWSEHVSDMSMYHAFTLPLEDFYRVYNFKTGTDENNAVQSVNADIQNIYGKAAIDYIDTLLRDINGGARGDSTLSVAAKSFSKFKKAAVMASLSVVVQQPSAMARAFAYIPTHYFIGQKANADTHAKTWAELKKYAPVAAIKEMGAFDMNVGKRTVDYIAQKEYDGLAGKLKGFITDSDYRDEAFGYAAGKADEITWCWIWNAAKRMAADTTDLHGEALLQKAGEIFTETIVNTQVYDSVMSRSQLMRSKNGTAQMLTAFMAEPTTTLNMLYDAVLSAGRGEKKFFARTVSSVVASVLINSALVSLVKAARDDDEDESYWEKWTSSFIGSTIDGINPIDMIPYVRDLHSIVKGYDVERSDVSVFADLVQAANKVKNADEDEAADAYLDFAANVLNFVGIPGTNILRETRAAINFVDTLDRKTTAAGVKVAALEGLGFKKRSDARQLYDALLAGDTEHAERVMARYETEKEAYADLRKYLREVDPRIKEAAQARFDGDVAEYDDIINKIVDEGKIDRDVIIGAVRAEEEKLEERVPGETKISSLYAQSDLVEAISDGEYGIAKKIKDDIVATAVANGKTKAEAERQFKSNASSAAKTAYMDGKIQKSTAISVLKNYSGKSPEDASDVVKAWDFEKKNGWIYEDRSTEYKDGKITRSQLKTAMTTFGGKTSEEADMAIDIYDWQMDGISNATESMIKGYKEVKSAGISRDIWVKAYNDYNDTKGEDANGDGKTDTNSKCKKVMPKINALPITAEQKTQIALQFWDAKTVNNFKLW